MRLMIAAGLIALAAGCATGKTVQQAPAPSKADTAAAAKPPTPEALDRKGAAVSSLEMTCKSGNDERSLAVVPTVDGCSLHYQKFGKGTVVASSSHGSARCETVMQQIRKNLETAGFACK